MANTPFATKDRRIVARGDFPFHLAPTRDRSGCFSIFLIAIIVMYGLGALSAGAFVFVGESLVEEFNKPHAFATFAISLAGTVGSWGIWKWRRWGIYLFAAGAVPSLAIELWLRKPVFGAPLHVTVLLVLIVLMWGNWRNFD